MVGVDIGGVARGRRGRRSRSRWRLARHESANDNAAEHAIGIRATAGW